MSDLKGQIRLLEEKNTSYMQTNMELEEVSSTEISIFFMQINTTCFDITSQLPLNERDRDRLLLPMRSVILCENVHTGLRQEPVPVPNGSQIHFSPRIGTGLQDFKHLFPSLNRCM